VVLLGVEEFQRLRKEAGVIYFQDVHGAEYLLIQGLVLQGCNEDGKAQEEIVTIEEQAADRVSASDGSAAGGYSIPPV